MQQSITTKLREEGYQELQNTPQVLNPSEESFNSMSLQNTGISDNSMPSFHVGYRKLKGGKTKNNVRKL